MVSVGPAVALHGHLVGSADETQTVGQIESLRDVRAEGVSGPPGRDAPALPVLLRVRPEQVRDRALVWSLLRLTLIGPGLP